MKYLKLIFSMKRGFAGLAAAAFMTPFAVQLKGETAPAASEAPQAYTARQAFVDLPVSVIDILSRSRRLDMLDYFDADSLWQATNSMGGPSVLKRVEPDFLSVSLTPVSQLDICILPSSKKDGSPIVMTLYTIGGKNEAPDTQISFFDTAMKPLQEKEYFSTPELKKFFRLTGKPELKEKEIAALIPFPTIAYTAYPGSPYRMTGRLTIEKYMSKEDKETLAPYLADSLTWLWSGRKWQLQKQRLHK